MLLLTAGCGEDAPGIRVYNMNVNKVNVQVKQENDNTLNFSNVESGSATPYKAVSVGQVEVTAVIHNVSESPKAGAYISENNAYTITITNDSLPILKIEAR